MAVCFLVRHGHSTANAAGLLAGWLPDVALTDRGEAQARALAAALGEVGVLRVVTSPLSRCVATAAALTSAGLPTAEVDDELGECHYGAWTGRALGDLARDPLWRTVQDDPEAARFPDSAAYRGESLGEMATRVTTAIRRADAQVTTAHGPEAAWVAVSHGDPIKAVLAQATGGGVAGLQRFHVDPGSVSVVRYAADRAIVLATNVRAGGLESLIAATSGGPRAGDAVVGGGGGAAPAH